VGELWTKARRSLVRRDNFEDLRLIGISNKAGLSRTVFTDLNHRCRRLVMFEVTPNSAHLPKQILLILRVSFSPKLVQYSVY